MGSPKRPKKKYKKPLVIWQEELIQEQKEILRKYGLKNKKEIWKSEGFLKRIRDQAKNLTTSKTEQEKKEKEQLINRLVKLSLIKPGSQIEDVLSLNLKNILDRRLQTIVYQKNLAKSIKQSRQFIVHGHISINNEKINVPSFTVPLELENKISFNPSSKLANDQHPERAKEKSRRQKKSKTGMVNEIDIFVGEKLDEVKINLEEKPKKSKEKVDEILPGLDITREEEFKPAGKAK